MVSCLPFPLPPLLLPPPFPLSLFPVAHPATVASRATMASTVLPSLSLRMFSLLIHPHLIRLSSTGGPTPRRGVPPTPLVIAATGAVVRRRVRPLGVRRTAPRRTTPPYGVR